MSPPGDPFPAGHLFRKHEGSMRIKLFLFGFLVLAAVTSRAFADGDPANVTASNVLSVSPIHKLSIKPGATAESSVSIKIVPGYHVNSNTPSNPYLIGLRLTWNPSSLETEEIVYPKPETAKLSFSETPVSVFSGEFQIVTHFRATANTAPGSSTINGKLRYQACSDRLCLPPKTIDVAIPVEIVK
jgi:hypothetical protein